MILICYTTPAGGRDRMGQAARTLGEARRRTRPEADVRVTPTPTREDFVRALAGADPIEELHLVSDGDADGPRFAGGEALSPEDWRALDIPFAPGAEAFFHAGRSARWFAPFFARTFGVPASGYHWDAAFSVKPHRFWWMPPTHPPEAPLWRIACPGPQTHGVMGAFRRAAGQTLAEPLKRFDPTWPLPAEAAG
ncbi:MAG: hypothetical protein H6739_36175 [Alphaproteobacteria bacterium]|nr:hypothetical protein [Alphaproteobacteria bacterium]